jgi:hypothetical protein
MTPVAYAASSGHRGLMELLLDAGAERDAQTAEGATPLLLAAGGLHAWRGERLGFQFERFEHACFEGMGRNQGGLSCASINPLQTAS